VNLKPVRSAGHCPSQVIYNVPLNPETYSKVNVVRVSVNRRAKLALQLQLIRSLLKDHKFTSQHYQQLLAIEKRNS